MCYHVELHYKPNCSCMYVSNVSSSLVPRLSTANSGKPGNEAMFPPKVTKRGEGGVSLNIKEQNTFQQPILYHRKGVGEHPPTPSLGKQCVQQTALGLACQYICVCVCVCAPSALALMTMFAVQKEVVAQLLAVHPVGLHGAGGGTAGTWQNETKSDC